MKNYVGTGVAIGIAVGASVGAALHNVAVGIGIGAALGAAFGAAMNRGGVIRTDHARIAPFAILVEASPFALGDVK